MQRVQRQLLGSQHLHSSGACDFIWRHETCVTQRSKGHSPIWPYHQMSDAAIVKRHSQPAFGGELQCSADNIADHVGMTDKDLIAVLLLLYVSSMNEVPKRSLNSSSIFVILLMAQSSDLNTAQSTVCTLATSSKAFFFTRTHAWGSLNTQRFLIILRVLYTYRGGKVSVYLRSVMRSISSPVITTAHTEYTQKYKNGNT